MTGPDVPRHPPDGASQGAGTADGASQGAGTADGTSPGAGSFSLASAGAGSAGPASSGASPGGGSHDRWPSDAGPPGGPLRPAVDVEGLVALGEPVAAAALALARRFTAGGTLWCVSPRWPGHGQHVAVEFVHPVIVGKRALPAVHVDDGDAVSALRLLGRRGDVVLAIGPAGDPGLGALLPRTPAWGLTSVWIGGGGDRPAPGAADHVLWIDGSSPEAAGASAGFVLLYHLLWELTHVVLEHPGLVERLDAEPPDPACTGEVCVTCSDEGRLAEVSAVPGDGTAVVLAGGRRETIATQLVEPVVPGDLVLVHAGTAITVVQRAVP